MPCISTTAQLRHLSLHINATQPATIARMGMIPATDIFHLASTLRFGDNSTHQKWQRMAGATHPNDGNQWLSIGNDLHIGGSYVRRLLAGISIQNITGDHLGINTYIQ